MKEMKDALKGIKLVFCLRYYGLGEKICCIMVKISKKLGFSVKTMLSFLKKQLTFIRKIIYTEYNVEYLIDHESLLNLIKTYNESCEFVKEVELII